jgi:hypothetical protein
MRCPSITVLDERKRSKDESLVCGGLSLVKSSGKDALKSNQALFIAAREVPSYYGPLIPSKRFKFSKGEGGLKLAKGIAGTGPLNALSRERDQGEITIWIAQAQKGGHSRVRLER